MGNDAEHFARQSELVVKRAKERAKRLGLMKAHAKQRLGDQTAELARLTTVAKERVRKQQADASVQPAQPAPGQVGEVPGISEETRKWLESRRK